MRHNLFILITLLTLMSCQDDNKSRTYLSCENMETYNDNQDLYNWQIQLTHNDTVVIQAFFDTIRFDQEGIINTVAYSWFQDSVAQDFDWVNYMEDEKKIIQQTFELKDSDIYTNNDLNHYWFYVKDGELYSYIEYMETNPLTIKYLTTSDTSKNFKNQFCRLNKIARQATRYISP